MNHSNFYSDKKYCDCCNKYVHYLQSVGSSYCVECGARVHLFSEEDWHSFNEGLGRGRAKGGRPRKNRGKESA